MSSCSPPLASDDARRSLPSVDRLVRHGQAGALIGVHGRERVVEMLRTVLRQHREAAGAPAIGTEQALLDDCAARLQREEDPSLRPVFNLSGTVLHTNLGRALLARSAIEAAVAAMSRATNLEFDVDGGARGERDLHVEQLLRRLTGAEAATVVNNNAAAVLLLLNTVAARKEVVVSRGELVEIGGAFRVPDVMTRAGCRLREVGTTNRTHLRDYAEAIGPDTAAIMKVHPSNYAIQGFTAEVPQRELGALAGRLGIPLLIDLGSGSLLDLRRFGLPAEPTPREAIEDGAAAVTFSGDKLLGGPQAGLIVGSRDVIERIRRFPMKRAFRMSKLPLAALEATLRLYLRPERLQQDLPTLRLLTRPLADIAASADRVLPALAQAVGASYTVARVSLMGQIGSGSLPVESLASAGLAIAPVARRGAGRALDRLETALRALAVPVIGRIAEQRLLLDLRCLEREADLLDQLPALAEALA